MPNCPENIHKT